MTSRERVLTALNHEEPDRVPIQVDYTPEAAEMLSAHLRLDSSIAEAYSGKISEIPLVMGHDLLVAWHGIATSYYQNEGEDEYTCEWGIRWGWIDFPGGRYTDIIERPLADDRALMGAGGDDQPRQPDEVHLFRFLTGSRGKFADGSGHALRHIEVAEGRLVTHRAVRFGHVVVAQIVRVFVID